MDMTFFNGDVDGRAPYKRDKADKEVQDFMVQGNKYGKLCKQWLHLKKLPWENLLQMNWCFIMPYVQYVDYVSKE